MRRALALVPVPAAIALAVIVAGCQTAPQAPPYPTDPAFALSSYDFDSSTSLASRVQKPPPFVLSYLEALDGRDYTAYEPSHSELAMIEHYIGLVPGKNRAVMRQRLVGIYFLETFLGGGFTEFVLAENDDIYAFMVFNAETLRTDLSEWITYRESTAFRQEPGWEIQVDCGSQFTGFLHVLIHESTHVVDYVEGTTRYLREFVPSRGGWREAPPGSEAFLSGIWKGPYQPRRNVDFPNRQQVAYYGMFDGPHLSVSEASETYAQLLSTPFVSLYASLSPWEDLAELVAWHHLTAVLGQPYRVVVTSPDDRREFSFEVDPATPQRATVLASFY